MSEEAYSAIRREMDERADAEVQAEDDTRQESLRFQQLQDQVARYFRARYGNDWAFKAPETFPNALERWMIYSTARDNHMAEAEMANIEAKIREQS